MAKRELIFVTSAVAPWGAEHSLALLARGIRMVEPGTQITVVGSGRATVDYIQGIVSVRIVRVGDAVGRHKRWLSFLRAIVSNTDRHSRIVLFSVNLYALAPALRLFGRQVTLDIHDTFESVTARWKVAVFASLASSTIAISKYTLRSLGAPIPRINIAPRPIVTPEHQAATATTHRSPEGHVQVGIVGRIVPEKRIEDAIAGIKLTSTCHLRVIGDVFDGSEGYLKYLQSFAMDQGVSSRVHFVGPVNSQILYDNLDILLSTNPREASGRTVGEAMARGVPVVVPTEGGQREYLEDPAGNLVGGLIWDTSLGSESIAACLLTLAEDSDLRARLGREGAAHIKRTRSPGEAARIYLASIASIRRIGDGQGPDPTSSSSM